MKTMLSIALLVSSFAVSAAEVCGPSADGLTLRFNSTQELLGMGMTTVEIFENDVLIETDRVFAMGVSSSTVMSTTTRRRVRSVTAESALSYAGTFKPMKVVSSEGVTKVILGQEELSCEVVE